MKLLGKYKNGNYNVKIYDDGTKIRENNLNFFESEFPENIDIKITNKCNLGCPMCHEKSTSDGLNAPNLFPNFINSLKPYTELAIGGGNVFEHPLLINFLRTLKDKKIIANITVNQVHFEKNFHFIRLLIEEKLIYGLGVSLSHISPEFLEKLSAAGENVVLHVINGIVCPDEIELLKNKKIKILFLGYKDFGRGIDYREKFDFQIKTNQNYVSQNLDKIFQWFSVVSFDNLAIEQINVKKWLTKEKYDEFYMGDEGQFTMYVDLVNGEFGQNSVSNIRYPLMDNIVDMFNMVKKENC
ncbi:MAG: hypothetical protein M0R38_12250 [Bacteroidia bacterium]|nr:hypothetical protein [Bacteroidia bacterium]